MTLLIFYSYLKFRLQAIIYGIISVNEFVSFESLFHHLRLRTVAVELTVKGHNVTFVSCDADKSQPNLHFIHMEKVYDSVAESDSLEFNIFEMGIKNIILQYLDTPELMIAVCDGLTKSKGWKQLNSLPKDFKVKFVAFGRSVTLGMKSEKKVMN